MYEIENASNQIYKNLKCLTDVRHKIVFERDRDAIMSQCFSELKYRYSREQVVALKNTFTCEDIHENINSIKANLVSFMEQKHVLDYMCVRSRDVVEFNPFYTQIITCALIYIKNTDKIICLRTNGNNRICDKLTLVQGHVNYTNARWLNEEIIRAMKKEIYEEIGIDYELLTCSDKQSVLYNDDNKFSSLEHIGVCYYYTLDETHLSKLYNAEDNKHTIEIISIHDVLNSNIADTWLIQAITNRK